MRTMKLSLVPGLLLALTAWLPAEDIANPSQEYLDQRAELEAMTGTRNLDLYEVTLEPIAFDRLVVEDRLGGAASYGYLAFRIRNQIGASHAIPISQSKGYNEVLDTIVRQYEQARVTKEHGVVLAVDGVEGKEGVIIERSDAQAGNRALDLSFQLTDEHGSRQRVIEDPSAPGAQDSFAFPDQGTTVQASVSSAVRDRVEEVLGRRLLTLDEIRRRFPLDIWLVVGGALAIADQLEKSGLARLIADWLMGEFNGASPIIAFIGIYVFTLVLTELMSNNAAAALAFPMGYQLALSMDVSTMPFILAVLFGASSSFILPYGYQTNLMVYAAGNYKMPDYLKLALPVSLAYSLGVIVMVPLLFPF